MLSNFESAFLVIFFMFTVLFIWFGIWIAKEIQTIREIIEKQGEKK